MVANRRRYDPLSAITTQGRLLCSKLLYQLQVSTPSHSPDPETRTTIVGLHGGRVIRPHALADRPILLNPQQQPPRSIGSHCQRLHRCARDGFLGPPSKPVLPTRILRHREYNLYYTLLFPFREEPPGCRPAEECAPYLPRQSETHTLLPV